MSSIIQQAQQYAGTQLKQARWALGLTGVLSIVFGIVVLVWPSISLYSLVLVFGAFATARGIVGLVAAIRSGRGEGQGWLVVSSLVSLAVGVIVLLDTGMSALALLYVIGAYAVALGVITVGGAFWLPMKDEDKLLMGLTGSAAILFGIVMFIAPGDGALVLLGLIAAFSLVLGIGELSVAIGGPRLVERAATRNVKTATPQASH
jgi:uncharacterized membrane protein HdeD (DUF308 family)